MTTSLNLCNHPPWVVASRQFNDDPRPIEIQGIRYSNRFLFQSLDRIGSQPERAWYFNDYMSVKFYLHQWQREESDQARRAIKFSYLRFLRGWGVDSNGVEGAVLKRSEERRGRFRER